MAVRALADLIAQAASGAAREAPSGGVRGAAANISLHEVYETLLQTLQDRRIFCRCACHPLHCACLSDAFVSSHTMVG